MKRRCVALLLILGSTPVSAQTLLGDPSAGQRLVFANCMGCHAERELSRTNGAPTFAAVAADPTVSALSLGVFLQTPHATMPNVMLSVTEIGDIAAYILGLRGR